MKLLIHISKTFWISTFLLFTICPVMGQIKMLKELSPNDYKLWSTLQDNQISDGGNWISFTLHYESAEDTLFVKNVNSPKTFRFPKGSNGMFFNDSTFGFLLPENCFRLLNLETNEIFNFNNVSQFLPLNNHVLIEEKASDGKFTIHIFNYDGKTIRTITGVSHYKIAPTGNKLAYVTASNKTKLIVLDLKTNKESIISSSTAECYPIIKWHPLGTSFIFATAIKKDTEMQYKEISFYKIKEKKLSVFDPKINPVLPDTLSIDARYLNSLDISTDEQYCYFTVTSNVKPIQSPKQETVQIWNAADKELYPRRIMIGNSITNHRLIKWNLKNNTFTLIGDNEHPLTYGHVDQPNILLYNEDENKPYFTQNPAYTFWLFNTVSRKKSLFLKELPGKGRFYNFSPKGKYFAYSRDLNWWLYSFETGKHTNVTEKYKGLFIDHNYHSEASPSLYQFAGWSENDETFFVYDEFDIWEFNTKTGTGKQLTFGRKNQEIYRLYRPSVLPQENLISTESVLVPGKNFIVRIAKKDNTFSGFGYLDKQRKYHLLVNASKLINPIEKAKDAEVYLYSSEDFDVPTSLCLSKGDSSKTVFQSNPHYTNFAWGKSQLVSYTNKKGTTLNGVLLFPARYNPKVKYPMIVYIYEKQTSELHHYTNPGYQHGSTLNISNYVNNGYFVLLPDIEFELGNPGFSATDCVVSAVKEVVDLYPIDQTKIGLSGHSWGGYETNFIITQTNLFAAAASGAALTHFNSGYLDYAVNSLTPQTWRYEYHQIRMKKSLFEDYNGYQANAPLTHAANISTPLLAYTGTNDMQVPPKQSIEFYLALRRLQKKHILLMYPNQNHAFSSPYSQEDVSRKMMEWFGYYLKGEHKPKWMEAM